MEESSCPSDCEEAEGKSDRDAVTEGEKSSSGVAKLSVMWSGAAGKTPLIQFRADTILGLDSTIDHPYASAHRLTFKLSGDYRLVHSLLLTHGFSEVSWTNARFNVYWSGTHIQMSEVRALMPYQRINHFPRSYVITRKDRLCQNISRMQHAKGMKHFNIIPTTFVLPDELPQFRVHFRKKRGTWIMKPVSLSRGRGIAIISHPNQVKMDEPLVVSQYIERPLCVNGYKFDLRIYVAVTSFNPLKIYIYEEGMTRFATETYSGPVQLDNLCMHLTNYSVNKKSSQYVRCDSPGRDDYGSKWSMSALLRHLLEQGKNVAEMMMKVEDVIIKALIAGESHISSACDVFQTHRRNCFELYGFDILIDEDLRPWLLEINLSPSLGCDTPFDLRLKSNLIADLLTLTGVPLVNPYTRESPKPPKSSGHSRTRRRSMSSSSSARTSEEVATVRDCREEYSRRCGFVRVFPSHDSWDLYSSFLESKGRLNLILHQELYPGRIKSSHSPTSLSTVIAKRLSFTSAKAPNVFDSPEGLLPLERVAVYLRKLENGPKLKPLWDSVCELLLRRNIPSVPVGGVKDRIETAVVSSRDSSPSPESLKNLMTDTRKSRETPHLPKSGNHVLSRHSLSRVLQRQSRVSRAHSPYPSTSQLYLPSQQTSTDDRALTCGYVETVTTDSPPPYNFEKYSDKLETSSLSLSQNQSLHRGYDMSGGGRRERERNGLPPRGSGRGTRREASKEGVGSRRLLRRTLSNQSLHSVGSDTSVQSWQSLQSGGHSSFTSKAVRMGRPQSATLTSKTKSYISPYAQPVLSTKRKPVVESQGRRSALSDSTSNLRQRASVPEDEDLVSEALHRLTVRQMMRRHSRSALTATKPPIPPTARLAWTSSATS